MFFRKQRTGITANGVNWQMQRKRTIFAPIKAVLIERVQFLKN